jgi:hypothetical protein
LDRGWKIAYQDAGARPFFRAPLEPPGIGGLKLEVDKQYSIHHNVPPDCAALADELELAIKYGTSESIMTMAMFWAEVNVTSRDGVSQADCYKLKILIGEKPPEQHKDYPKEYLVWVMPDSLQNGWVGLRLRLPDIVAKAVGSRGYVYESVKAVQLRGCISISPIKFLSSVPQAR